MNVQFFRGATAESGLQYFYYAEVKKTLTSDELAVLEWLLEARHVDEQSIAGKFVGPRKEMVTPWSTNATEIAAIVGIPSIERIEIFGKSPGSDCSFDRMLQAPYQGLNATSLVVEHEPQKSFAVKDIAAFNRIEGLALSNEEIEYLEQFRRKLSRDLSDVELFAFSQINSEHCRHKIFNGRFIVDGEQQERSLFALIKETSARASHNIVSAYRDNVAFVKGPHMLQFAPDDPDRPGFFSLREIATAISLKAETHNFPTTVEPFNGASTGSGGEIRDRMAGGLGGIPLAGTAVYMTANSRINAAELPVATRNRERPWKYQTPSEILIKASNGASDFGNKFGQPLIVGSVLTFEQQTSRAFYGYDRAVMLAGGIGYANARHAHKLPPEVGDKLVVLGGDNYRIGMAGGSVSSVDTGEYSVELELSAVQRANPEMQKRVFNVVRALAEQDHNPVRCIHDHGAGGHVNCFSEILDPVGGEIQIGELPVGDKTLSVREILCNESQERMGLLLSPENTEYVRKIAERERAPFYVVGEVTGSKSFIAKDRDGSTPFNVPMEFLFGSAPLTVVDDQTIPLQTSEFVPAIESGAQLVSLLKQVLSFEAVACKDWLTNKVDRSVTGKVALQQCCGPLQLPLNNLGVAALDYSTRSGVAVSLGHAPIIGLIDERAGSVMSLAEALTNIIWAPLAGGLSGVSLSANWMWPAKQPGEDVRLYRAVEALSEFAIELGIAVPTGKDSLSMTMKYGEHPDVRAPGTVIISATGQVSDVRQCVTPNLVPYPASVLLYIDLSGSSDLCLGASALLQAHGALGDRVPTVNDVGLFSKGFECIQSLIRTKDIIAGHDVSAGGLITCICEMAFSGDLGVRLTIDAEAKQVMSLLFCEKPSVVLQVDSEDVENVQQKVAKAGLEARIIGELVDPKNIELVAGALSFSAPLSELRNAWLKPSFHFDSLQTRKGYAEQRFATFGSRGLSYKFPPEFSGRAVDYGIDLERKSKTGLTAAVIREKGTNGDRELAFALFAAGFDVKDVTMSDLIAGRETLSDVSFVAFPGGFSNSDVLGAARGWGGAFKFNKQAMKVLQDFYSREDTLSLGVCNGCQLMVVLDLMYPDRNNKISMCGNSSGKFESSFLSVKIANKTNSVLLDPLRGSELGIWVAHGEGHFSLPDDEASYDIPMKFVSSSYPQNPNGSRYNAAALCSANGRHLVMMPHIERSILPWQWGYYPQALDSHEITPWVLAFASAREWLRTNY